MTVHEPGRGFTKDPWQVRVFRSAMRVLPRRMSESYREEIVDLFRARLDESRRGRIHGTVLLVRALVDAARHGAGARLDHRSEPFTGGGRGRGGGMDSVVQDVRFAFRSLGRRPLFTAIALITLGLGIGGTTTMFSVVNGVLVEDLPYDDPDAVVSVWKAWPSWQGQEGLDYIWDHIQFPWEDYLNVRNDAAAFSAVSAHGHDEMALTGEGEPEMLSVGVASANLFRMLGIQPVLGRSFLPEEVAPDGEPAPVLMLSHELWTRRFAADSDVLGQTVILEGETFQVIGVLPAGFRLGSDLISRHENGGAIDPGLRQAWVPIGTDGVDCGNCFELLGRLAPGRTASQARDEVQALMTNGPADQIARVVRRKDVVTNGFSTPLLLLLGAASVLLLVACTNVAGLLIGEASRRHREISVRSALGATRGRIVRLLLTENLILGLVSTPVGIALAWLGTDALLALAPPIPRLETVGVSLNVLLFAIAAGLGSGVLFGLVPALSPSCNSGGPGGLRSRTGDSGNRRVQSAVVSVQVGLTVMLLVAGALFGRSLIGVMSIDPGFDPDGLMTLEVEMPAGAPGSTEERLRFWNEIARVVEEIPGVQSVSAANELAFPGGGNSHSFGFDRNGEHVMSTQWARWVQPSYHETLSIPLMEGRLLSDADGSDAPGVMLVSESLAQQNWPDEPAIGVTIRYWGQDWTVVGIVGDIRQKALGVPVEPTFYVSTAQMTRRSLFLVVRTATDPSSTLPALREAIWSVHRDISIAKTATMMDLMRDSEADDSFRALLMWTFALLATVLATVGIFGVTARGVSARSREIGIRTALGAHSDGLVRMVLRDGLKSAVLGTALGLVGAFWASSLIAHQLYEVGSHDPWSYAGAAALSIIVCLLAAYVPARRAATISPMEIITEE